MAKTYGTVATFTAGSVLTAAQLNVAGGAVNNLVVPATAQVRRTTNQTGVTSGVLISWQSALWQNDGTMWAIGDPTKLYLNTTGLYVVTLHIALSASSGLTQSSATVLLNGTEISDTNSTGNGTGCFITNSFILNATAGQYLTAYTGLSGGAGVSYTGNESVTRTQTRMTVSWIGRTA